MRSDETRRLRAAVGVVLAALCGCARGDLTEEISRSHLDERFRTVVDAARQKDTIYLGTCEEEETHKYVDRFYGFLPFLGYRWLARTESDSGIYRYAGSDMLIPVAMALEMTAYSSNGEATDQADATFIGLLPFTRLTGVLAGHGWSTKRGSRIIFQVNLLRLPVLDRDLFSVGTEALEILFFPLWKRDACRDDLGRDAASNAGNESGDVLGE